MTRIAPAPPETAHHRAFKPRPARLFTSHIGRVLLMVFGLAGFGLILAACGETRDSAAFIDAPPTTDGGAADDPGLATTTTVGAPVTTGVANETALSISFPDGDSVAITHGELAEVAYASRQNQDFIDSLMGGSIPENFDQSVLSGMAVSRALDRALSDVSASVSEADQAQATASLKEEITVFLGGDLDQADALYESVPYISTLADLRAKQAALGTALAATATAAQVPCVRHILLETEADATEVLALAEAGGDFATLAAEHSTGPTGPNGGDLGCAPSANYVPEFAAAVEAAIQDEVVGPVETQFGHHLILVYGYEEAPVDPAQLAGEAWTGLLGASTVEVDPALGTWDPFNLAVVN